MSLPDKSAGRDDLRQRLIDMLAVVEQMVIDCATDRWRRRLHAGM